MSTTTTSSPPEQAPRRRRRIPQLAVAAAAAGALGIGALALLPGDTPEAVAAVQSAAEKTSEVTDFRMTMVTDGPNIIPGGRGEGEVDGDNVRLVAEGLEFLRVDGTDWTNEGDGFQSQPSTDVFLPFDEASEAVLTAALTSEDVTDRGTEDIRGVSATRYEIAIDDTARDALGGVPPEAQYWFVSNVEEEVSAGDDGEPVSRRSGFLEDAGQIDVWVADGLVHRISVDGDFTLTFYDFGADITITAPEQ